MSKKQRKSRQTAAAPDDPALDQWVARQLHKVYDDVLSEPVPEALLRLVERLDPPVDSTPGREANDAAEKGADMSADTTDKTSKD
mgnify:CR=1 FL=1